MKHRKTHKKAIDFSYEYSKSPVQQVQDGETGKLPKGWDRAA